MHNYQLSVTDRVMDFVNHHPECLLEEVVQSCRGLSWNQVFLEVDRLSRKGQVRLRKQGMTGYILSVPGHERMGA